MILTVASFLRDRRAASAAEFALVLPLLLIMLFGIIDAGRFAWEYNQAEKATQMGVRYAVVTEMVPDGLEDYSFAVSDGIQAGSPVPIENFEYAECDTTDCSPCSGSVCGSIGYDFEAFDAIVLQMTRRYPPIKDVNVTVEYRNVRLGYSGDPNGPDVAPLVTVRLQNLTFKPLLTTAFKGTITMPDFSAALTLEDGTGTVSN